MVGESQGTVIRRKRPPTVQGEQSKVQRRGPFCEEGKISDGYLMRWTSSSLLPSVPDPDMTSDLGYPSYQMIHFYQGESLSLRRPQTRSKRRMPSPLRPPQGLARANRGRLTGHAAVDMREQGSWLLTPLPIVATFDITRDRD